MSVCGLPDLGPVRGEPASVEAWERAWEQYLHYRGDPVTVMSEAGARDEAFVMGPVFATVYRVLAGTPHSSPALAVDAERSRRRACQSGRRERDHVGALELLMAGEFTAAVWAWHEIAVGERDFAAVRYVLNGTKHWITGGGVSKAHLVFARVYDTDGTEEGIGAFLAFRDETPGLEIGPREPTMGLRGIPETTIVCNNADVGAHMAVQPPSGLRRGFADLMNAYNTQRVGAGTVALGLASGAYALALEFVKKREQFGRPIAEFQGLQWMLADMSVKLEAARSLIYRAAASRGPGGGPFPDPALAAQAKIFTSEAAIAVVSDALQAHGAAGYSRNNPLERMYRDVRMFTIGGGTAQILRTVVASRILEMKLPQSRGGYLPPDPT